MSLRQQPSNVDVVDEKKDESIGVIGPEKGIDVENGHLQELEVDMQHVLEDQGLDDIDGDTSPYPEGMFVNWIHEPSPNALHKQMSYRKWSWKFTSS